MKLLFTTLLIALGCQNMFAQSHQFLIAQAYAQKNGKEVIRQACAKGDSLMRAGDYGLAETYYQNACNVADSLLKFHQITSVKSARIKKWGTLFDCYDKAAMLYALAGNPIKAKNYFEESIQKRESVFPKKSVHRIAPYIGLGKMYYETGNTAQAFEYFGQAEQLLARATTSNYNYDNLNEELYYYWYELNLKKGNIKQAAKYLERFFLAVNTTSYSSEQLAVCFEAKARYYLALNDFTNCDLYLKKAEGYLSSLSAFSKSRINILRTRAILLWMMSDISKAADLFKNISDAYRLAIEKNFPAMSEHEREQFYSSLKNDFDLFNSFVLSNQNVPQHEELYERLYNNQLFTKALLLNEINKIKTAIMNSDDQVLKNQLLQWQQGKEALAELYFNDKTAPAQIQALEQQLDELEKKISLKSEFLNSTITQPDWKQVASTLKPDEAAIEIVRVRMWQKIPAKAQAHAFVYDFTDSVYYLILMINPAIQHPVGFVITDGAALENRYLHYYRNSILAKSTDTLSYTKFWRPIQQQVAKYNRVFISTDGVYNQINLNALQNPTTRQYLLDEKDLVLVTNTKDLLTPPQVTQSKTADLYGKPAYSFKEDDKQPPTAANTPFSAHRSFVGRELLDLKRASFTELPGTEKEIVSIGKQLTRNGWTVHEYLGKESSETRLKTNPSPTILHIATHGFFQNSDDNTSNSMIRSGIILSGVNNTNNNPTDDGILTAYEATDLNLNKTELVVLSACETGLGVNKNGEGVYGLQRGFKVAGAKNMIMSLWRVDDFATAFLMEHFYNAWTMGAGIHQAFRQAQLELRQQYPEPFYWSAFILLGN